MNYFGTDLREHGHYFWQLEGGTMRKIPYNFKDYPFNPEDLPKREVGETIRKGDVKFYHIDGYTICAIEGSCVDNRWGTESVFFIKEILEDKEMIKRILSIPIALSIINQMPFNTLFTNQCG